MTKQFQEGDVVKLTVAFTEMKYGRFKKDAEKKRGVFVRYTDLSLKTVQVKWFGLKLGRTYHVSYIEKVQVG